MTTSWPTCSTTRDIACFQNRSRVLELAIAGDVMMAKKRISSVDLGWLIFEKLREDGGFPSISLAVVADSKAGWRAVIAKRSQRFVSPEIDKRLVAVQKRLRLEYELRN